MDIPTGEYAKYWDLFVTYATEYSLNLVGALAIFVIGKWVAKRLTLLSKRVMERAKVDKTLTEFTENLVYIVLMLVVILAALNTLGVATTSFVAIA